MKIFIINREELNPFKKNKVSEENGVLKKEAKKENA
jgi:hypothetical protein